MAAEIDNLRHHDNDQHKEQIYNNRIFFHFYTLLYNIAVGRWIINDFPLILLYLDSLAEYHDRLAVMAFPVVSDKSCYYSLSRYRELSELRGIETLDITYHNLADFPVNEVGGIVVTVKQRPSLVLDLSLELFGFSIHTGLIAVMVTCLWMQLMPGSSRIVCKYRYSSLESYSFPSGAKYFFEPTLPMSCRHPLRDF